MLFWEALSESAGRRRSDPSPVDAPPCRTRRLPYDTQCVATTKSGARCRGRIRKGTEFCPFHDPDMTAERRRRIAAKGGRNRHRLSRLPDGYLRKLGSRAAVGEAMDRLYREVRLEVISAEMGAVLFGILTRLLDSGLAQSGPCPKRSRAARIRPKLGELLTRAEQAAWQRAMANDMASTLDGGPVYEPRPSFARAVAQRRTARPTSSGSVERPLQAAS